MRLDQSFEVEAPLERVWEALLDIERVAPCLPGASVTGTNADGTYEGSFHVKIGPTTASYAGKLALENVDEASHTATMQANGSDRRGQGAARATIVSTLQPAGERTRVEVDTDYHITGRLARFGRGGMIEDIAGRLLTEFAQNLQALLESESPASGATETDTPAREQTVAAVPEALDAGSMVASVAWQRARSSALVPSLVAGLLLVLLLRRRRRRA
jgi:carbon monoxide dehydrogenase subunit G